MHLNKTLLMIKKTVFFESIIQLIASINEDLVIIGGDLNRHVGKEADGYNSVHEGYGFGVRNTEGERVLEMGTTLDMVVWNIFFKKRDSRLITYKVLVLAVHKFTAYISGTKTGSCRRYESNTQ